MTAPDDQARLALRALVDAYAACADERDAVGFAALFAPDGELSVHRGGSEPVIYRGPDRLAEIPARLARYAHTFHDVGYHSCLLGQGHVAATGVAGCRAHHVAVDGSGATDLVLTIRYRDDYTRTGTGWRFARREVHILWTDEHPVTVA